MVDDHRRYVVCRGKRNVPRPLSVSEMLDPAESDDVEGQGNSKRDEKMLCRIVPDSFLISGGFDIRRLVRSG